MPSQRRKIDKYDDHDHYLRNIIGDISNVSPKIRTITEGDPKIETVHTLSFIYEISKTICEVLDDFTKQLKSEEDRPTKSRILSHYNFMRYANQTLNVGIGEISKLQKQKKVVITNLISESRADYNLKTKRAKILQNEKITKKKEQYLHYLLKMFRKEFNEDDKLRASSRIS